ncbi:MAG: corrinoid protein [Oscillospiraceae bacterium]|nr:corrinoid protein [Oscillospiraceae bacterium]MDY4191799.1 corrinoid protein [Oscillospiraceae bacterium]
MEELMREISELLQKGRAPLVKEKVQLALDQGISPKDILENGLLAGMDVVGEKFKNNQAFVPEVLIAARAMNNGISVLQPYLTEMGVEPAGCVVIGTVKGDLHDIGKNLVKLMLEGKGFSVVDLGVNVSPDRFVEAAKEHKADIVCCSALLTTTMVEMKSVDQALRDAGIRDQVKFMVGGAPVTQTFADSVGADCYTPDAATCAEAALKLCRA